MSDPRRVAEEAARHSYGRLVAYLAARTRDIAAAEDALGEAFAAALRHWPVSGVPESPEAWLLTAARRKLIDRGRRAETRRTAQPDMLIFIEGAEAMTREDRFADERLRLLFICAHPAIDPAMRTPLMLQTVLGLDAARIASAFLVAPPAMGQRLVRAKRKIADAGIPFETPSDDDLPDRAGAVLDAIYAAFGASYNAENGDEGEATDLAHEALFLATLVASLLAVDAEALGLLALVSYIEARRNARRIEGVYFPLDAQDVSLWDPAHLAKADEALGMAAALKSPGRYQLEAAIQSAHMSGRISGDDTSAAVVRLYERLIEIAPSIGAEIGQAAALVKVGDAERAISVLNSCEPDRVSAHQPYWATRAHALQAIGDIISARLAFDRAIGLSSDQSVRAFLAAKRDQRPPTRSKG